LNRRFERARSKARLPASRADPNLNASSASILTQRSSETPERILDAAERLFARQGVAVTSLRSITMEAGVNTAAIHYHFGSKRELVAALLKRRIVPISRARLERLTALEARHPGTPIPIAALVEAFVAPIAGVDGDSDGDSWGAGPEGRISGDLRRDLARLGSLLAWLRLDGDAEDGEWAPLPRPDGDVQERFARALCRGRELDLEEASERFEYAIGAIAQLLRPLPQAPAGDPRVLRRRLDHLIGFLVAGLGAPSTRSVQWTSSASQARTQTLSEASEEGIE